MRAVEYLSTPADPEFVHHMLDEVGLSERDRSIAWSFRKHPGMEMDYYADLAQIPRKKFTAICGWIFRRQSEGAERDQHGTGRLQCCQQLHHRLSAQPCGCPAGHDQDGDPCGQCLPQAHAGVQLLDCAHLTYQRASGEQSPDLLTEMR